MKVAKINLHSKRVEAGWEVQVHIVEGSSESEHLVIVTEEDFDQLTKGKAVSPEALVEISFRFLLERESKESILPEFKITKILDYFPDYKEHLSKSL